MRRDDNVESAQLAEAAHQRFAHQRPGRQGIVEVRVVEDDGIVVAKEAGWCISQDIELGVTDDVAILGCPNAAGNEFVPILVACSEDQVEGGDPPGKAFGAVSGSVRDVDELGTAFAEQGFQHRGRALRREDSIEGGEDVS